jgi:hypothetical protein
MQRIRFTCQERRTFSRARCFSPRCLWQRVSNNHSFHRLRPVPFPMLSRQKAYRPGRSRRSIPKKTFEFFIAVRLTTAVVKTSLRCAGVGIAICSWFVISNHCAFAALATKTDSVQTGCPFHSKPAKQEKQSTGVQCCKILRGIVPGVTKCWNRDHADFSSVDLRGEERVGAEHLRTALTPSFLDTGPPNAHSFAELILQRSLLVHAPPLLA